MLAKSKSIPSLIGSLILFGSIVLVCGDGFPRTVNKKGWIRDDLCLFFHPKPSDELDPEELFNKLNKMVDEPGFLGDKSRYRSYLDHTINLLYKTKKDSTALPLRLTIDQLVACNEFKFENCMKEHFKWRGDTLEQMIHEMGDNTGHYNAALLRYLQATLYQLIERCHFATKELVKREFNTRKWLLDLGKLAKNKSLTTDAREFFRHNDLLEYIRKEPKRTPWREIHPRLNY